MDSYIATAAAPVAVEGIRSRPVDGNAIFGFAGVLVGAGGVYLNSRGAEARKRRSELKVAIRLVEQDALALMGHLTAAIENQTWWFAIDEELAFPNWTRFEGTFARELPLKEWWVLRNAFAGADHLEDRSKWIGKRGGGDQMDDEAIKNAKESILQLQEAVILLTNLAKRHEPWRRRFKARV